MTAQPPYVDTAECRHCGDVLTVAPDATTNEWCWVGPDGLKTGMDPEFRHLNGTHPWTRLDELGQAQDRYRALPRAERDDPHEQVTMQRAVREYGALLVRLSMGGCRHVHSPRATPAYVGPPAPRSCCGPTPWLRPDGWHCRECGQPLTATPPTEETPE